MKEKIKSAWKWLRKNVFNKEMIIPMLISEAIFWSPCIVTGIMGLCGYSKAWIWFSAVIAFWAGPFTPATELQIGLAFLIKKLFKKKPKQSQDSPD
ncbi:MAG: hypothetical protein KBT03_12955 [Bacteroidales bacterium]|nr:hypothetical protein [Candidatus Scybalousia scybalohippi]